MAVLAQLLVAVGSVMGRQAHFTVGADRHYPNLFSVIVGETAKARKGTSWSPIRSLMRTVDESWKISSGLSSGEGLIEAVRDPISKHEPIKEKGRVTGYQEVEIDPGVSDKRLLVIQSEFASTLHVMERDGNTLSALIRQAWDDGDLGVMTKNSPTRATGAHISVIGHVTRDELVRYLDRTEMGNGFANRILWICVRRSRVLPDGGALGQDLFAPFVNRLRLALEYAKDRGELRWDEEARALWHEVYGGLSEGRPGMLGAITSRAEAQVLRLSLIYALLDGAEDIRLAHLQAALAFWKYADDSARFIFGDSMGDPDADTLLAALRSRNEGMTRAEIVDLFGRHRQRGQIDRILAKFVALNLANPVRTETGGRPAERWRAVAR